jgi:hypothetical protein
MLSRSTPDPHHGPLITRSYGRPLRWRDILLVFFPATLAVFAPLGYGIYRASYAYTQFGPSAAEAWSRSWLSLAAFATLILLLLALYRLFSAHRFLAIHEHGLHIHASPFRDYKILWSQISGVSTAAVQNRFLGLSLGVVQRSRIYLNVGKSIDIDRRFGDIAALTDQIETYLQPLLQSQIHKSFSQGKWIYFGDVAVHQEGLQVNKRLIPWSRISHLYVDDGFLVVKSVQFEPTYIPVSKIPNLVLLFKLVESHPLIPKK